MPEVQYPAPQHVSNFLEVADAKKPRKAKGAEQKQQSSSGLRKERSVPSKKSDSMKSQAGKRSNLIPMSSSHNSLAVLNLNFQLHVIKISGLNLS